MWAAIYPFISSVIKLEVHVDMYWHSVPEFKKNGQGSISIQITREKKLKKFMK